MFAGVFTREQIKGTLENYKQFDDGKEQAIAQLTTDGQFIDHVREIIRFFKSA